MNKSFIELNAFIKRKANIATGGQAKLLIRSGKVFVNGEKETRNKRKLVLEDKVVMNGKEYVVDEV